MLLEPIGVGAAPADLGEAVRVYLDARASAMDAFGVCVDPELGRQVSHALRRHQVIA